MLTFKNMLYSVNKMSASLLHLFLFISNFVAPTRFEAVLQASAVPFFTSQNF